MKADVDFFVKSLLHFDYHYAYSDDHRVYKEGARRAKELRVIREKLNKKYDNIGDQIWERFIEYVESGFDSELKPSSEEFLGED